MVLSIINELTSNLGQLTVDEKTVEADDSYTTARDSTSPKGRDLRDRSWYALHNGVADNSGTGGECAVRGSATPVEDPAVRGIAVAASSYDPADRYVLFQLGIDDVAVTDYDDEGPRRRRWPPRAIAP